MYKAIVTGASGFIGVSICKELCMRNIRVIALVRKKSDSIKQLEILPGISILYIDSSNYCNLKDIILDRDISILYHFAWEGSAGELRGNSEIQINNVRYTCDIVKACADMNIKRFVFAASIMEFEIETLMKIETVPAINTVYSSAKLSADYIARTMAGNFGIEYIRAVISNVYGPGEISSRLINSSIRKMLLGEHCAFSDCEQMYDFIYIDDAAKSIIAIGEKGRANKTYYIGSQNPKKLKYFLMEIKNIIDPCIELGFGEMSFNGVSIGYDEIDSNAVEKDTGFVPMVSFTEGIQRTINWIRKVIESETN